MIYHLLYIHHFSNATMMTNITQQVSLLHRARKTHLDFQIYDQGKELLPHKNMLNFFFNTFSWTLSSIIVVLSCYWCPENEFNYY
jgi:hypothetical protein